MIQRIESGGGPLILVPESCLSAWRGHEPTADCNDYIRACEISSYIDRLRVGGGEALVLGDTPDSTAILPADLGLGLHRWICGDSPEQVERELRAGFTSAKIESKLSFRFTGECYVLFDSAYAGWDYPESLEICPPAGDYMVVTRWFTGSRAESLVHIFEPCKGTDIES